MAALYGVARGTVCKHIRRLGITRPESGENSRNRKRSGEVIKNGYPVYHKPDHPRASAIGYVFKHVLEVEKHTGSTPGRSTPIHHIDFDRANYHISNLHVCRGHSEHLKIHRSAEMVIKKLLQQGEVVFRNGAYEVAA